MIVEDDESTRRFLKQVASVLGFTTIVLCENAVAASRLWRQNSNFDAIITDFNMPGMTGLEFAKIVKGSVDRKTTKIILLTGDRKITSDPNVDVILHKPVAFFDLKSILESLPGSTP